MYGYYNHHHDIILPLYHTIYTLQNPENGIDDIRGQFIYMGNILNLYIPGIHIKR